MPSVESNTTLWSPNREKMHATKKMPKIAFVGFKYPGCPLTCIMHYLNRLSFLNPDPHLSGTAAPRWASMPSCAQTWDKHNVDVCVCVIWIRNILFKICSKNVLCTCISLYNLYIYKQYFIYIYIYVCIHTNPYRILVLDVKHAQTQMLVTCLKNYSNRQSNALL